MTTTHYNGITREMTADEQAQYDKDQLAWDNVSSGEFDAINDCCYYPYDIVDYYKRCEELICDTSNNEEPREINKVVDRFSVIFSTTPGSRSLIANHA